MKMVRKQIYLEQWQQDRLAELAREFGASEAEIVRSALKEFFFVRAELPQDHPLSRLAGIGAGPPGPGAAQHDEVLYRGR